MTEDENRPATLARPRGRLVASALSPLSPCPPEGQLFRMKVGGGGRWGDRRMSKELDDVTRTLAEPLVILRYSKKTAGAEVAITRAVDCVVMALGSIERRLDLLERGRKAKLH
jgi:hypothetical protein